MEYKFVIYCEECTKQLRPTNKYGVYTFESLTEATNHIIQYGHVVKIDLEATSDNDYD
jgi:hypothetical protein